MSAPIALCIEQTLGHRAHTANLQVAAAGNGRLRIVKVDYPARRPRTPVPWAIRGSYAAWRQLRAQRFPAAITLFHTQSIALFANEATRRRRYAISIDATPRQLDSMGSFYRHRLAPGPVEALKDRSYRRAFHGATALVAWSAWAADGLAAGYRVPSERIAVIHPGATPGFFAIPRTPHHGPPNILFVGGDFARKGGPELLEAFSRLRTPARLTLVTNDLATAPAGVTVLRGINPATPELFAAFASADIFCLPTHADCTSVAIGEALAAGLPVVTTTVGSNGETVRHGETGLLTPRGDVDSLTAALEALLSGSAARIAMGERAREDARDRFNAAANAAKLFRLLEEAAR